MLVLSLCRITGYVMAMCLSLCLLVCVSVRCSGVVGAGCCNVYSSTAIDLSVSWSSQYVCLSGYVMVSVCRCVCVCVFVLGALVMSVQDAEMFTGLLPIFSVSV